MAVDVRCKNAECGKAFRVGDEYAGKAIKCPKCGQPIAIPPKQSAIPSAPPAAAPPATKVRETPLLPAKQMAAPTRRSALPWIAGMVAMFLLGTAGGYLFAAWPNFFGKGDRAPVGQNDSELAKLRVELDLARAEAAAAKSESAKAEKAGSALAGTGLPGVPTQTSPPEMPAPVDPSEPLTIRPTETPPPSSPVDADGSRDLDLIQGLWKGVDDRVFPFSLDIIIVSLPDDLGPELGGKKFRLGGDLPMSYTIDPTQNPKTIDLTSAREGKTFQGIYDLKGNGDLLTIAVHLDGETRPKDYILTEEDKANDKAAKSSKWVLVLRKQR